MNRCFFFTGTVKISGDLCKDIRVKVVGQDYGLDLVLIFEFVEFFTWLVDRYVEDHCAPVKGTEKHVYAIRHKQWFLVQSDRTIYTSKLDSLIIKSMICVVELIDVQFWQ